MIVMKKIKYNVIAAIVVVAVNMTACNKLDEYNPSGATADAVWTTPQGFVTAVNGAYAEQRAWYGKEDGIFMSESGTDLWFNRDKNGYARQMTRYEGLSANDGNPNKAAWRDLWKTINLTNAGINRIGNAGFTNIDEKNRREGELRFMRAFAYWHIVETWGAVMLRTTETQGPILTATRSSIPEIYNLILSDLEFAATNLPNEWGNEYSRATKKSALGFLARALLSRAYYSTGGERTQFFQRARDVAKEVIDRKAEFKVQLMGNYANLWLPANNKKMGLAGGEALYVISNSSDFTENYDNNGNRLFHVFQAPYNGKPGLVQSLEYGYENGRRLMPTRSLLDFYNEQIDSRYYGSFQEVWIANTNYTWNSSAVNTYKKDPSVVGKTLQAGIDTALLMTKKSVNDAVEKLKAYVVVDRDEMYHPDGKIKTGNNFVNLIKYRDPDRVAAKDQPGYKDIIVMRLAEMYLIAAEAEHQLGNPGEAAKMINVLRTRAAIKSPVDYTAAMQVSAADINDDFILAERARELAGEHLRWFDVKRVKNGQNGAEGFASYIKRMNPDITLVEDYHRLRPIPIAEMTGLQNAEEFGQNFGYN